MKRILFIITIITMTFSLLGCSDDEEDRSYINFQNQLESEEISYADIEIGGLKRTINNQKDIDLLHNYINNIQALDEKSEASQVEIIRISIYGRSGDISESISIGRGLAYYNNQWMFIDTHIYDEITTFYNELEFEEVENQSILEIIQRSTDRQETPIVESLYGTWKSIDGSMLSFDEERLIQGEQTKYSFDYEIDSLDDNNLSITVYGRDGFFLSERELSTLEISMDQTKTHMKMKRTMTGGKIFDDKLIYVDEDGMELGFFDSYFFYEDL